MLQKIKSIPEPQQTMQVNDVRDALSFLHLPKSPSLLNVLSHATSAVFGPPLPFGYSPMPMQREVSDNALPILKSSKSLPALPGLPSNLAVSAAPESGGYPMNKLSALTIPSPLGGTEDQEEHATPSASIVPTALANNVGSMTLPSDGWKRVQVSRAAPFENPKLSRPLQQKLESPSSPLLSHSIPPALVSALASPPSASRTTGSFRLNSSVPSLSPVKRAKSVPSAPKAQSTVGPSPIVVNDKSSPQKQRGVPQQVLPQPQGGSWLGRRRSIGALPLTNTGRVARQERSVTEVQFYSHSSGRANDDAEAFLPEILPPLHRNRMQRGGAIAHCTVP